MNSKLKPWRRTREFTLFIMYRIFISHSWSYSSDYDKIESFLRQEGIAFYNHSVPKNDPIHTNGTDKQLSDAIEAKVKGCSCIIILAGVYATYSKWINKEIEMAKKYSKPIIAVQPWGAEHTSNVVKNAADVIVGWNAKSVANAVHNYAIYNPQIQISAESETKRSIFREKDKTKRSKKESAQHSKSRNKSFVMTSVSAL